MIRRGRPGERNALNGRDHGDPCGQHQPQQEPLGREVEADRVHHLALGAVASAPGLGGTIGLGLAALALAAPATVLFRRG